MDYKIKVGSNKLEINDLITFNIFDKLNENKLYYIINIESKQYNDIIFTIKSLFNHEIIILSYGINRICWHDGPQYGYNVISPLNLKVNFMINIQINYSFLVMKSLIKNNKLNYNVLMLILEYYTDGNHYRVLFYLLSRKKLKI